MHTSGCLTRASLSDCRRWQVLLSPRESLTIGSIQLRTLSGRSLRTHKLKLDYEKLNVSPISDRVKGLWLWLQGAKKIIYTACLSGKLKLEFTSPDIISNSPKPFWRAELISQFFCYSNSSKSITCPSGKLKTEFTCPIAKSTSPGLSDTTFFARWPLLNYY